MQIKDLTAFNQKTDFIPTIPVATKMSDADGLFELPNYIYILFEGKKHTTKHLVQNVKKTSQWQIYKNLMHRCCNSNLWFIYATHNEEISDKPIPANKFNIKFIRHNKQETIITKDIPLIDYLNRLGSVGLYYITVTFPDNNRQFCLKNRQPTSNDSKKYKYATNTFYSVFCCFHSQQQAKDYIKNRFSHSFNQKYKYTIYYRESFNKTIKLNDYTCDPSNRIIET